MATIRVEVTPEDVANAGDDRMAWASPVEDAIARLTGVGVSIDGNGELGNIATIGTQESSTLVVELPADANAWLDARWVDDGPRPTNSEPLAFDLELDDWVVALIAKAASVEEQGDAVLRADGLA